MSSPTTTVLRRPIEAIGFWTAVALPFLYLPLLLSGPKTRAELWTGIGLVGLHVLALLVGHSYRQDAQDA